MILHIYEIIKHFKKLRNKIYAVYIKKDEQPKFLDIILLAHLSN